MKKVSVNSMQPPLHYFWLNPYREMAFTRCPKCEGKTMVRKKRLAIDVLNKTLLLIICILKPGRRVGIRSSKQYKAKYNKKYLTWKN